MYKLSPTQHKFLVKLRYWLGNQTFMTNEFFTISYFIRNNCINYSEDERNVFNKIRNEYLKIEHIK